MIKLKHYLPTGRRKLRWWLIVAGLFLVKVESGPFTAGTMLLIFGSLLHFLAKGHLRQNTVLTLTGPYRWVRNPFYLANLMVDTGLCFMINRLELTVVYLSFWIYVYIMTIRKEERNLEEIFGDAYLKYKAKVPRLIPYGVSLPKEEAVGPGFSWKNHNISEGAELPRLLRFFSYPFLFLLFSELHKEKTALLYGVSNLDHFDYIIVYGLATLLLFEQFVKKVLVASQND